nr:hypothetical protein [Gemmatimonadales bacterium]
MRALALAAVLPLAMALGWAHGSQVASEERGDPSRLWAEEPRWVLLALRLSEWNTLPYVEPDRPCSFLVGQASSMDKVFREAADFRGPFSSQVEIAAAGRERESFQLVLLPVGEALRAVEVDISDLLHEDGRTRLPATCVTWHPVGYVQTKPSASAIRRVGWWWPDILLPAEPFDVELGFVQPVWFTVEVPDRARAGTYHGLIKLNPAGIEPRVVGLELTVRSFSLPLRGKLKTAFSFNPGMWAMWYHPEEVKRHLGMGDEAEWGTVHELNSSWECAHLMPGEKWREVYGFLLAHRLNPTTIYAHLEDGRAWVVPGREDMEYCYERGMNATCLAHVEARFVPSDPEEAAEYLRTLDAWLADWQSFIEEKGWQDFTWYVHGFDESDWRQDPETTTDPWIRRIYGGIGATFPQIKRESANPLNPLHIGLFDIWTPQTG